MLEARFHSLNRTNPKGQPFIGKCIQCGMENLPASAVNMECKNTAGLTEVESLMRAIEQ